MQGRAVPILAAAAPLSGCAEAAIKTFATLDAAARDLVELLKHPHGTTGAWTLGRSPDHATRSGEYSMTGYPLKKSALFRAAAGAAASPPANEDCKRTSPAVNSPTRITRAHT